MQKSKRKQSRKAAAPQWPKRDPYAEREASRYEHPIPSREWILMYLKAGGPRKLEQIAADLGVTDARRIEALGNRLRAMERAGQVVRNRRGGYGVVEEMGLIRGRVIGHPDGFGFLVPEGGGEDIFLSAREMRRLLHGDRAVVQIIGTDRRGRKEGAVVEVLERANHEIVGRYIEEQGVAYVVPDNKRIAQDILIRPEGRDGARDGQIVVAEILRQPDQRHQPVGQVVEVLGEHMAPGMEIDVAIRVHGLPHRWPEGVEAEAAAIPEEVAEADKQGRVDLRHLPLVTIDGEDARDFDDAVHCRREKEGWRLWVAIADVSHYVHPGTALDAEAENRGNSVYFPERVIPMLPEVLSNGLCSLNPRVDRLCMVCEMEVSPRGKVLRSKFYEGVMRSAARLTYTEVNAAVVERDEKARRRVGDLLPHLEELYALYRQFDRRRKARGAIEFETTETRIVFGEQRKIERIEPCGRNDAHRLIEECMIAANVEAARFLLKHRMPTLFRVHEPPDEEKVENLRLLLGELGLSLGGGENPGPQDFARVLEQAKGRDDFHLIQMALLRSLKMAIYSPKNQGHFGLALEAYAHFTSPIRRYPDLMVHRAIRHHLRKGRAETFPWGMDRLEALGEHCSMTDRRAEEATRDAVAWLKCEYMMDKVGEEFDGVVSAVTSFGLFVELQGIYIEGLVHVTELKRDYYHFDPIGHRLTGEHTGRVFRIGNKVRVQVTRVDLDERKIDLHLVGEE